MKLCFDSEQRRSVVVKFVARGKVKKGFGRKDTLGYRVLQTQVATLKKIAHASINRLIEFVDEEGEDYLYYITEYAGKGSLLNEIGINGVPHINTAWNYFRQIVSGISYVHEVAGITHRNLTLRNLLLDNNGDLKIADLGHRFLFDEERSGEESWYDVPRDWEVENKSVENDVWAMGVCLYYMVKGKLPYTGHSSTRFLLSLPP